MKSQENLWR